MRSSHRLPWQLALACAVLPLIAQALPSAGKISPARLLAHTTVLSSDAFEGRAPGSAGEIATVRYLTDQFKALGLQPGNPDGSYVQKVPLLGISSQPALTFGGCAAGLRLQTPADFVATSSLAREQVAVADSPLVFVGYGIQAPEYGWDDYKGVDVRGKILLMLVGDPPLPDPADPGKLDEHMFRGRAMTYYGRWTYKFEIAAAKGAAGAIIVHETGPAGYGFPVVVSSWYKENFTLRTNDGNSGNVPVQSWLQRESAQALFKACGEDFDELKQAALRRDFKPLELAGSAAFKLDQILRPIDSQNVVARLEGADPHRKRDWLIYSAHWDHLGRQGDQIYHGAADNAAGVASLLEIARAFKQDAKAGRGPARSVLFLATTAEESGLLGARHYVRQPLYPLARTVANINIDGINNFGPTRDITLVGAGQSDLEARLSQAAAKQGRRVVAEARPETGSYFRGDHFEFARVGIPVLNTSSGNDFQGRSAQFAKQKFDEYVANDYHKPSDVIKPDWNLAGGAQDMALLYLLGRGLANGNNWPRFASGSEFRPQQDSLLKAR
ncbi:M28 family peptidase [Chitinimonas arctica]|uniref:M28 family peptidase n=1 Tax=Chitinimonas arctica TaxID=2594795 RepID=A0A516SK32_9NEIS|nr:M28 family peptidase [Chitinimonas arctica]QDQ28517.1 M28 family peptidase [Chitinimonas arctica]